ncbi:hypothetical protein GCM10020331_045290 [Ectobacillus funiculus]
MRFFKKKEEIMPTGESDADYQFKQLHLMQESQDAAIYNAYKRAEKQVSYENKGVIVLAVSDKMPAKKRSCKQGINSLLWMSNRCKQQKSLSTI